MVYTKNVEFVFEWDTSKAKINESKHGVSFELEISVFDDPDAWIAVDDKHSTEKSVSGPSVFQTTES